MSASDFFDFDIIVMGAGAVGLALAVALRHSGRSIALIDSRPEGAAQKDARVLALALGTQVSLAQFAVWEKLQTTPIASVHISQWHGPGRTLLTAQEFGAPALGYVAHAGSLASAFADQLKSPQGPTILYETTVTQTSSDLEGISVTLTGQHQGVLRARLLVCAEGAVSGEAAAEMLRTRDYAQHALISEARGSEAPVGRAFERFTPEGPLAFLPWEQGGLPSHPGEQRYAVVHVGTPSAADAWMNQDDPTYLATLQTRIGTRLRLTAVSARLRYPLVLRYRKNPVGERTVWLGNAAQTLHPVAGQGFNLALRDVCSLAEHIQTTPHLELGSTAQLAAYARSRQWDRQGVIHVTDGLVRIFSNENPLFKFARGAGLLALDLTPPLRHFLGRRLMFGARAWP